MRVQEVLKKNYLTNTKYNVILHIVNYFIGIYLMSNNNLKVNLQLASRISLGFLSVTVIGYLTFFGIVIVDSIKINKAADRVFRENLTTSKELRQIEYERNQAAYKIELAKIQNREFDWQKQQKNEEWKGVVYDTCLQYPQPSGQMSCFRDAGFTHPYYK